MRERNIFDHEVGVHFEVAAQHFCRHDLAYVGVYDLVPGVGGPRNHEAKVKLELLDDLAPQGHDLFD